MADTMIAIPESLEEGFLKLRALSDDQADSLLQALQDEQVSVQYQDIARQLSTKLKDISAADLSEIIQTLLSFYSGKRTLNMSNEEFAAAVVNGLSDMTEDQSQALNNRLVKMLGSSVLLVSSKASEVLAENQRNFIDARIMTDIRPLFTDDASQAPIAAVIVHMLRVGVTKGRKYEDLYIAMDTQDLKDLRSALVRADEKANSLKQFLANAQLPYLDAERS